jgi:hypothetical protein
MSNQSFTSLEELVAAQNAIAIAIASIGEALSALQATAASATGVSADASATSAAAVSAAGSAIAGLAARIAIDPGLALTSFQERAGKRP